MRRYKDNDERILAYARRILTNQIALPFGIMLIARIFREVDGIKVDLTVFETFLRCIPNYPIGTERLLWNKEALKKQECELDSVTQIYRDIIFDKCFEIIEVYKK